MNPLHLLEPPMLTLALVSQKGGSGKTTLALHLACAAAQAGERVAVIDTDPQASARAWAQVRQQPEPAVTRLNLSNNQSFALCWEASREEAPHGAQAVATPVPCGFSASLADSPASGGRGRTTADGRAQSVAAGPAPAGTARSAPAAPAHPHAAADPDPARDGSHHCEPGVAAGTVHC